MEVVMKINRTFGDNALYLTYRKEKFLTTKPNKEQNHGIKLMDSDETVMWETTLKFFKVKNLLMKYNNLNDVVKKSYWKWGCYRNIRKKLDRQEGIQMASRCLVGVILNSKIMSQKAIENAVAIGTLQRPRLEGGDPMASWSRIGLF